ncbi:MAG: bifunctional 2-methylcitrate synthase/citrate synthase [Micavibrio sp.]|nr:MAG: bifunctional 2-methylcitrate synthase/citrate synthase [Micavibrio sp.]
MTSPQKNDSPKIHKGLVGVFVDDSKISEITQETSSLTYRGYAVQDLAENCNFEEVAYLLWHGELPDQKQLDAFVRQERSLRKLDDDLVDVLKKMRKDAHPMDVLRTAISYIGANDPDWADETPEGELKKSVSLLAKMPTIIAAHARISEGKDPIAPRDDLSYSENFLNMRFGKVPEPEVARAFDVTMMLYAEHSFNVSTFTARTITSSLSDIYSAVTGAVGSLKGRLHGGANEAVMTMLEEIGTPEKAETWLDDALKNKKVVMGFGHAVYKNGDSRVPTLKKHFNAVAKIKGGEKLVKMAEILEAKMLKDKNIRPNVDYPIGPLYHMMGFKKEEFTPMFAMARIVGWTSHVMEQRATNKLIRPLCTYGGPAERKVPPMAQRGDKTAVQRTAPAVQKQHGRRPKN